MIKETKVARRSKEMQDIIDIIKKNMRKVTYDAVSISDLEAERILVKKILEAGLVDGY